MKMTWIEMILSHFFMISTALLTSYFISRKCFILEIYIKKSKIKVYLQEKKETVKYFV